MLGLLQDLFMDLNISLALLALVVAGCVRWLRPILILPWGLVLFIGCVCARFWLWNAFGGEYYELTHAWSPEEIPGSTSVGFGFAWALTVFGFSLLFFAVSKLLVLSASRHTPKP
jgi:hypothetical protein